MSRRGPYQAMIESPGRSANPDGTRRGGGRSRRLGFRRCRSSRSGARLSPGAPPGRRRCTRQTAAQRREIFMFSLLSFGPPTAPAATRGRAVPGRPPGVERAPLYDEVYVAGWGRDAVAHLGEVKNRLQEAGLAKKGRRKGRHRERRERKPAVGQMLHQDASAHEWVPGESWDLVVTMDDATGEGLSGFFVEEEGTWSSMTPAVGGWTRPGRRNPKRTFHFTCSEIRTLNLLPTHPCAKRNLNVDCPTIQFNSAAHHPQQVKSLF